MVGLKPREGLGIALRPELYSPSELIEFAVLADESGRFSHLFLPDIPGGPDPIEISSYALSRTKKLSVGTGVVRLLEHDQAQIKRRLQTIQALSGNRFVLGAGTGNPGPDPKVAIEKLLERIDDLKRDFEKIHSASFKRVAMPKVFIAALRIGIARKVVTRADGLLLNFCSPEYAKDMFDKIGSDSIFACYIKIFYASRDAIAKKLLLDEFAKYDRLTHYHNMFAQDKVAEEIRNVSQLKDSGDVNVPKTLNRISLANPSIDELRTLIEKFFAAGITLPCVYPYFALGEDPEFKKGKLKEILSIRE